MPGHKPTCCKHTRDRWHYRSSLPMQCQTAIDTPVTPRLSCAERTPHQPHVLPHSLHCGTSTAAQGTPAALGTPSAFHAPCCCCSSGCMAATEGDGRPAQPDGSSAVPACAALRCADRGLAHTCCWCCLYCWNPGLCMLTWRLTLS